MLARTRNSPVGLGSGSIAVLNSLSGFDPCLASTLDYESELLKLEQRIITNLRLGLGNLRTNVLRTLNKGSSGDGLLTLLSRVDSLDLARGLDNEIDDLRLAARLISPEGRKEPALAVGKLVKFARNIKEGILKVDVLDELAF